MRRGFDSAECIIFFKYQLKATMDKLHKIKILVVIAIGCFNLTCFDMYNDMLNGTKLRAGVYIASSAGDQMYIINSEGFPVNAGDRFPAFSSNQSVALDYDNDGDCDIARIANIGNAPLQILLNNGNGYFSTFLSKDTLIFGCTGLSVSDFNNDGRHDFVISNVGPTITIYTFADSLSQPLTEPGTTIIKTALGDINGDGRQDILCSNNSSSTGFFINTSSAIIQFAGWMSTGVTLINDSAISDIDGDGDNDIIMVADQNFFVLKNDGSGTLTLFLPGNVNFGIPGHISIDTGDLNNDGEIDAIIGNSFPGNPGLCMINNGNGTFTKFTLPVNLASFNLFDIDYDGDMDIICQSDTSYLRILKNDGNANFTLSAEVSGLASVGSITVFTYEED